MEFNEIDQKRLSFIKAFQQLLNRPLLDETTEVREIKQFSEYLKWRIRSIVESMHKQDMFNGDFSLEAFCQATIDLPLKRFVEQKEKPWLRDKLTIALMGHLKTGKTSAMNCYFGETFPTSTEEATALATYLYYGDNPQQESELVDKEGGVQLLESEDGQLFSLETSFNFPFARMFSYIAKKSSHEALKDKTFIDTPGLFSSNDEHSYSTYQVVDNCDVIFWFVDCRKSISETELNFIKEYLLDKPVYFIFTFVDHRGMNEQKAIAAINVIKDRIAEAEIDAKGFLTFGNQELTKGKFKNELKPIIKTLSSEYEASNPIFEIVGLLSKLRDLVIEYQKAYISQKNKLEQSKNEILNAAHQANSTLSSSFSSVARKADSMIDTFNNRCANAMFCGGAAAALSSDMNQVMNSFRRVVEACDEINYEKMVEYGIICGNILTIDDMMEKSEVTKNELNELLNNFIDE